MLESIIKDIAKVKYKKKQQSYKKFKLIMQKPQSKSTTRTSSKKLSNQQQVKQVHRNQATQNQKYQNIKQFKMEIDYEIAKCLDTLDRQGLKYLKETLKSSNVFNQEIKEVIAVDKSKEKAGGGRGRKVEKSPVKGKNQDHIQEEIVQEYQVYVDNQVQEPPSKDKTKLGPNPTNPLKQQKIMPLKLQKFQDKIQQPLKPFAKRTASRQGSKHVNGEQQIKKAEKKVEKQQQHELTDKSQIDNIVDKISNLPEQKLKKVNKFIQLLQRSQRLEEQQMMISLKQTRPYLFKPEDEVTNSNQSNMRASLKKNKKNQKATSLHDSILRNKKNSPVANKQSQGKQKEPQYEEHNDEELPEECEVSEQIPEIDESQHYINQPKIMDMPDQMMKQPPKQSQQEAKKQVQQKGSQINMGKRNDSGLIKKGSFIKNFPISNIKKPLDIEVTQSHQADTLQLNQGFSQSQSKMVRLGKKKLGTNKVKIVLLRNRGHPSIIGLTCIQLYNTSGKQIPITLQNITNQSPKLLKLFNSTYKTTNQQQMFTTIFKRDYEIDLQISQKIGGMKIWNYNKSQIDNTKETDWIQLYINDRLVWDGYVNKGSYNQINDYVTVVAVQQGFQFGEKADKGEKAEKGEGELGYNYRSQNVNKNEGVFLGGNADKNKQRDTKKVDWLENTLMQQKIKKIIQQQQSQKVQPQIRRTATTKLNRFSQIYCQQQSMNTKIQSNNMKQNERQKASTSIGHKKQEQYGKIGKLEIGRQKQLIKQIKQINQKVDKINNLSSQRANRTNSQKIQEKDIFSSFGQSLIKEKNKVNQINAKTNQILEKVDKLKETYSKKDIELGYSSLITKQQPVVEQKPTTVTKQQQQPQQQKNVQKKPYNEQSIDDFMNDSLFHDPAPKYEKKQVPSSIPRPQSRNIYEKEKQKEKVDYSKKSDPKQKIENKTDIDDLLNQLNDLVGSKQNRYEFGSQKQKQITIPQLPKGNKIQLSLYTNWGDQQYIGINKIQFFDNQGQRVYPTQVKLSTPNQNMINSFISIFSQHDGFITQQTAQWKCHKKEQRIGFVLNFGKKVQFAFIRVWNFVGDRVQSMVGVKKMEVLVDGSLVFVGDVRKNAGTSRQQILRSCQNILFTNNTIIQKRILQSDWLANQLQNLNKQTILFKKTSQNFMRPQTTCQVQRQLKQIQNKQPIKLPKRNCFQYDPPTLPSGYYLRIILHTTWGDRDFVGLNGIVVYDQVGVPIMDIKKVCQFPAPLVTLVGYEKDKRVLSNLFDGKNLTSSDQSIWLAPYLRDVDKMEKQAENSILIQFNKVCTFSAVNIYNYVKTPTRGARQIEIYVDNSLAYRGYLRMANLETGEILTTINFTKDTGILQKIGYAGYHEDNLGQQVVFYNQGKIQKPIF